MSNIKLNILENKYLRVKILDIGATLYEVFDKKKKTNLILNLGSIHRYLNNKAYLGSTCGRYANRIKNAQFKIDSTNYHLSSNEGKNLLHGGKIGFDKKLWKIIKLSKNSIDYQLISPDQEEGFPGEVTVNCRYSINKNNLIINLIAKTSKKTHINLVNHAYWNLEKQKKNIFDHELFINADCYLKNDKFNIPTGKLVDVKNTPFDFRNFNKIGNQIKKNKKGFDENFVLKKGILVSKLKSTKNKILLKIYSNQPGVQFYTGQHLNIKYKDKFLRPFQGLCLETQAFPNSPNMKKFPSTLLIPGKKYSHSIKFEITHFN